MPDRLPLADVIERAIERHQHPPTSPETIERWRELDQQDREKDQAWEHILQPSD